MGRAVVFTAYTSQGVSHRVFQYKRFLVNMLSRYSCNIYITWLLPVLCCHTFSSFTATSALSPTQFTLNLPVLAQHIGWPKREAIPICHRSEEVQEIEWLNFIELSVYSENILHGFANRQKCQVSSPLKPFGDICNNECMIKFIV